MRNVFKWQSSSDTAPHTSSSATISLLSNESNVNNNDSLLLRSTRYEAKYVQPPPLMKGSLYIQDPNELSHENNDVEINKLTLSQLYATSYLPYIQSKQRKREIEISLSPGPPDFDGELPTEPERVIRYIKGLADFYRNEIKDPSPFQLYDNLISGFIKNTSTLTNQGNLENKDNFLNDGQSSMLNSNKEIISGTIQMPKFQSFTHSTEVMALTISMWLSNIQNLENFSIIFETLKQYPSSTQALTPSVIKTALEICREILIGDKCSQTRKCELCSLIGLIILPRGDIKELLEYVDILEDFCSNSKSNIVPSILPYFEELIQNFSLSPSKQYIMSSPVDAYHSETTKLPLMLSEGTSVICFCISPCGRFLAVATVSSILLLEVKTGKLLAQSPNLDMDRSLWILQFSSNSDNLILTTKAGLRHVLLSNTLEYLNEHNTEYPAIPTKVTDESIDFLFSPRLPCGRKSSLFFAVCGKIILDKLGCGADKALDSFVICTHLHSDFVGNIVILEAIDEVFTFHIQDNVITLSQGTYSCFGLLPNKNPWHFIYCKWNKGTWTLGIDNTLIELRGTRSTQAKTTKIIGATILDGTGHISSLVAWSGNEFNDIRTIKKFSTERIIEQTVKPFFNLPLDEGEGLWIKELATVKALTLSEQCIAWDDTIYCPCIPLESYDHNVRLPQNILLQAEIMISDYQILIVLPSVHKGGDGIVVTVKQGSKSIDRIYRCPGSYSQVLYFLSRDESFLYIFQQRFSTFSKMTLSTVSSRKHKLQESGIIKSDTLRGSPEWLCNEILQQICIEGIDLLRIPSEISSLNTEKLHYLASILRNARQTSNSLKLVTVMTLAMVHFERLVTEDVDSLSRIASSLNRSCKQIMEWFPEKYIHDVAETLVKTGANQSLTITDKVDILINADDLKTADVINNCMCKESLYFIISFVINEDPSKIILIANGLLKRCKLEEDNNFSGKKIFNLMLWFSIYSVQILYTNENKEFISRLLELYIQHAEDLLVKRTWDDSMQQTVVHTGFLPLLITIANICPDAVTLNIETSLLALLDTAPQESNLTPFIVSFETKQACDIIPATDDAPFKFLLDYTRATSVAISKEISSSEVTVTTSDSSSLKPTKLILNNETSFVKIGGSLLVLFGSGENSLTIVCNYDLNVGTSWSSIMRDCILNLLLATSKFLTSSPKQCDVFLAPLLRHGLLSKKLSSHGLNVPGRVNESKFASDILNNIGDGENFVDDVLKNMRGSVTLSMRPAIQALLSILIHSGLGPQQAEDELKLRWFSGEWGSRLQGAGKDSARQSLVNLAKWITTSVFYQRDSSILYTRRASNARKSTMENIMGSSQSTSDMRGSTTSRRSTVRGIIQNQDTLDQVRALFSKDINPEELENILVERTASALSTVRGLQLLSALLSRIQKYEMKTMHGILEVLWLLCGEGSGKHMIDNLVGSGVELEMRVRLAFHSVLERCESILINSCSKDLPPQAVLTSPANNGSSIILLLAIMCHPWDAVDCDIFKSNNSEEEVATILGHLENQMNLPPYNLPLTNPWRLRREQSVTSLTPNIERTPWSELIGTAENSSINCILPNSFSVAIPSLQLSVLDEGIAFEKIFSGPLILRADEAWPMPRVMSWFNGVPRVFYYEVTLTSPCHRIALCLGQCRGGLDRSVEVLYFYENSGTTHDVSCPPFDEGDTIGCGIVATTRRIFFTLNGVFISFMGTVHERTDSIYPTLRINNREKVTFTVNFGSTSFLYDFRKLHPALCVTGGPSWYSVASTAEIALHYITARACSIQDSFITNTKSFLINCCEVVCRSINKVSSSVINVGVGKTENSENRIQQAVILSVAESSIINFIATLRHILQAAKPFSVPDVVSEMLFGAVTVLMMLPLHSIQMSTISFLPELLPHIRRVRDSSASSNLVKTLFEHAKISIDTQGNIPFVPYWRQCDTRYMSITHMQLAYMQPESQRSIILGSVLPQTGKVSFIVRIFRKGMSKGHSLKGGYYIGISVSNITPLSPTSNSQSWKAVKPPIVWALHDISPQLPHATNPTVKPNNFHRTFGSGDTIRVVVDCDNSSVSFYRDDEFLKTLFTDIPSNIDLVPFVQLYNEDASVFIGPGEMTAPISSSTLLGAASVDVLRCMLTLEPFERLVADGLCEELEKTSFPNVTLALFKSTPDPRILQLCMNNGEKTLVTIRRLSQWRAKFSIGNIAYYENISNLRTASSLTMNTMFDINDPYAPLSGVKRCISSIVSALNRLIIPLVTTQALSLVETQQRGNIVEEEKDQWEYLFHGARVSQFISIQRSSQSISLLESPIILDDYAFSAALSHPGFEFSSRYCGRLATVPSGAENTTTPFIAIAEPSIPNTGRFNLRCQLLRGHNGQILGGGYYVGVCLNSFDWKRRDLNVGNPEVWAIHDMDDAPWRLRHLYPGTRFHITADPSCIIVSGDIIRLEIDRDEGIMHAYRKGVNQEEVMLGLIFDNLPKDVELFPFVHLYNTDAVAVLLPSDIDRSPVRTTVQQPHFALSFSNEKRNCDGCTAQHIETKLNSQVWYKCNECVDYNLCKTCFLLCMHSHHSFTEMGSDPLVYCSAPPTKITVGMNVVIPASNSIYLKSRGCRMVEKRINCVAESKENNALAIWGIVFKKTAIFTVTIDTINGEPLSFDSPMFIGVGEAETIVSLSSDALRTRCMSGSAGIVSICNDSSMTRKITSTSLSPCDFKRGSTVTIEIDTITGIAIIRRDWVTLGTQPFPTSRGTNSSNLVGFVLFGKKNVVASVFPEECQTLSAVVEDISSGFLRVKCRGRVRILRPEHCRLPLTPCQNPPKVNTLGYIFVKKELVQCKAVSIEKDEIMLHFPVDDIVQRIPFSQFLTGGKYDAITEERLLHREVGETGATMNDGFVISRLLLILSCMCENDTLFSILVSYCPTLLSVISRMAAVEISNDAPTEFIQEVRTAVALTCNCIRVKNWSRRLSGFMPSIPIDNHQYKPKKNMLMCAIEGLNKGKIYKVTTVDKENSFTGVEINSPSSSVILKTSKCIPVKQCDLKPWWTLNNGLPCNLLEHTLRVTQPEYGSKNVTMEGEWQGEIMIPRRSNGSISLRLKPDCTGVAIINFSSNSKECNVFGEYMRYSRRVRLCLFASKGSSKNNKFPFEKSGENISFEATVEKIGDMITGNEENNFIIILDGIIDAEGQRVTGMWKPKNDRAGTFTVNSFRRVTFISPSTELAHIEPFPECKDPIISSPPQRDIISTMHRLIVLLARHLYLFILSKGDVVGVDAIQGIIHYHSHPLTDKLISTYVDMELLLGISYKTLHHILDPTTKPWDSTTLSLLITKCVLLRPEVINNFPSLLWDSFHAVVLATHQCGMEYRYHLIKNLITFVERHNQGYDNIYIQLLSVLLTWVDRSVSDFLNYSEIRKDVAAGVELVMSVKKPLLIDNIRYIPLSPLKCLIEMAQSFREGNSMPKIVDIANDDIMPNIPKVEPICTFGELVDGILKVGKVMSSCSTGLRGKYYYETTLPEKLSAPFVIGWGTEQHSEVPSQHVGSDIYSFAFSGNEVSSKSKKEEYKAVQEVTSGSVIGCMLDMDEKLVAWSVNGSYGPFIPIPIEYNENGLYAFTSTGSCSGMRLALDASQFIYVPDNFSDLSGRYTRVVIKDFNEKTQKSILPIRPISFYEQLASYISDVEEATSSTSTINNNSISAFSSTTAEVPEISFLRRYPSISQLSLEERKDYTKVIKVAESCMATTRRFIDLDSEVIDGHLSSAFLLMKHIVRRSFGKNLLVTIPPVEKNSNPSTITVHITELYSTLPRTPEVALQHSVLSQIYKQIGSFTDKQLKQTPLFKVNLYIAGSGHAPHDLGGPYRQLWTFLSEEIMAHPDKCYPHTDYHRNPLCRYLNNSQRVSLVPDSSANSAYDLILLNFLGKIMGHIAAAKTPLALDFSPFLWKYLVEDTLTIKDYYKYVDSVVEKSMEDEDFLLSGMAEEIIPNFSSKLLNLKIDEMNSDELVTTYRQLAEECLVHSIDLQLNAIREGMWSVLPKRVIRCLSWRELERMVCGDSNLTPELMREAIEVQLQGPREQAFWRIIDELSVAQRSSFLCFACGQKRLPLVRRIKVTENAESVEHLPRAQSCSSLVTVPQYDTYELFKEKLVLAIAHEMEMELA